MAKGYSSVDAVALYLGRTLTADQITQATSLLDFVEAYIDRETSRSWLAPPVTAERHDLIRSPIYLEHVPVLTVDAVRTRTVAVGDTPTTLVAGSDYELVDAALGELRIANVYGVSDAPNVPTIVLVDYTPTGPDVPADIARAATMIVGQSLNLALSPDRLGVQSWAVDDIRVTYQSGKELYVCAFAQDILDGYRFPTIA